MRRDLSILDEVVVFQKKKMISFFIILRLIRWPLLLWYTIVYYSINKKSEEKNARNVPKPTTDWPASLDLLLLVKCHSSSKFHCTYTGVCIILRSNKSRFSQSFSLHLYGSNDNKKRWWKKRWKNTFLDYPHWTSDYLDFVFYLNSFIWICFPLTNYTCPSSAFLYQNIYIIYIIYAIISHRYTAAVYYRYSIYYVL